MAQRVLWLNELGRVAQECRSAPGTDCLAEDAEVIKIGGDEIQNRLRPVSIGVV
jgi:hypothetical protein